MTLRHWAHSMVTAAVIVACAAVAAPAAASEPAADASGGASGTPEAAATAYLQARAAAIASADPASALAEWVQAGTVLARDEAQVAAGTALRGQKAGRSVTSADCRVIVLESTQSADGESAIVRAHAVTTIEWQSARGSDVEGAGADHALTLVRAGDRWLVSADLYLDDTRAASLEAAGAAKARVRAAARAVERASSPVLLQTATAAPQKAPLRRYSTIIKYDRDAAKAYADKYALDYNPTWVHFGADCANFASQCGRAGGMPMAFGSYTSGWWYDKNGTSGPGDDTYSWSWINVVPQMGYWNQRRTDYESSVSDLARGDFVYYDWSGDGVWDHVAVVVGTNSSGQKVVDAHTTDHYHAFWKLGNSATKYKFARTRVSWII